MFSVGLDCVSGRLAYSHKMKYLNFSDHVVSVSIASRRYHSTHNCTNITTPSVWRQPESRSRWDPQRHVEYCTCRETWCCLAWFQGWSTRLHWRSSSSGCGCSASRGWRSWSWSWCWRRLQTTQTGNYRLYSRRQQSDYVCWDQSSTDVDFWFLEISHTDISPDIFKKNWISFSKKEM